MSLLLLALSPALLAIYLAAGLLLVRIVDHFDPEASPWHPGGLTAAVVLWPVVLAVLIFVGACMVVARIAAAVGRPLARLAGIGVKP